MVCLHALLRVETDGIEVGGFRGRKFPLRGPAVGLSLRNHSRVVSFIEHPSTIEGFTDEGVAFLVAAPRVIWAPGQEVRGEIRIHVVQDPVRLSQRPALERHYDEQVHVGVARRAAIGIGAKEDDPLGLSAAGDPGRQLLDATHLDGHLCISRLQVPLPRSEWQVPFPRLPATQTSWQ